MVFTKEFNEVLLCFLGLWFSLKGTDSCGYPGSPPHAKVDFNTDTIQTGTVVTYNCESGFDLLGPARRLCLENRTWIPSGVPACVLNVAYEKASMQSSVAKGGSPQKAVNGNTNHDHEDVLSSCTLTSNETNPWWYVNLLEPFAVQLVRVDFGIPCCVNNQIPVILIRVGNNRPDVSENPECNRYIGKIEEGKPMYFPCVNVLVGAFVSVHIYSEIPSQLSICEAFVYTDQALSPEQCSSFEKKNATSVATHNGWCYAFHSENSMPFNDAHRYCKLEYGDLILGTSPALQGFLSWELYKRHRKSNNGVDYWNGAVWIKDSNSWRWYDGTDITLSFWNKISSTGNCSKFESSSGWLWAGSICSDSLNFICQNAPKKCGYPGIPPNATAFPKNTEIGSEIKYQCNHGHVMVGSSVLTCLPSGFYSSLPPTCLYIECGKPANIINGGYNLLNNSLSFKSMVLYYCFEGYILVGRESLTCESDQKWNGPPPRCDPIACHNPPSVEFGNMSLIISSDSNNTKAEYSCEKGFSLIGPREVECDANGSWPESVPYCRVDRSRLLTNRAEGKHKRNRASIIARLNMGGIISLGIFGGFVFLAVIISIVVIIIRRSAASEDSENSISTYGTGNSRERLYEQQQSCCNNYPSVHHNLHGDSSGHMDESENVSSSAMKHPHSGNNETTNNQKVSELFISSERDRRTKNSHQNQ